MATSLQIQQLYLAYLGRPPEPAALAYYAGMTLPQVQAALNASPEAQLIYNRSNGQADAAMVATAYAHLFGRVPLNAEAQFWVGVGRSQGLSQSALATAIAGAAQGSDSAVEANRMAYVQQWADTFSAMARTVNVDVAAAAALAQQQIANISAAPATLAAATSFTTTTLTPPATAATPAPAPASTIFTTGTDHITTADGTIVYTATLGTGATLTANDSLQGAGNQLNISDTSGIVPDVLPTGVSLTGVATISLTTAGNAGTDASHPFDLSGVTGLTQFNFSTSGTGSQYFKTASGVALSGTVATSALGAVASFSGGFASLNLTATSSSFSELDVAGSAGAITLHLAQNTAFTLGVDGLTLNGGFSDADNRVTALTIAGTNNLSTIDAISGGAMTGLTVSGKVQLGSDANTLLNLPSSVNTLNLAAASSPSFVQVNNPIMTITVGKNTAFNTESDAAPNLVLNGIAGAALILGGQFLVNGAVAAATGIGSPSTEAAFLQSMLQGNASGHAGTVYYGSFGGNLYLVENSFGTSGVGSTTIVEIIGSSATPTVTGGNIVLS